MKLHNNENKKIKLELKRMIETSREICRILDKDDVDIKHINKIGKKTYLKGSNSKANIVLPNLIYFQGQLTENSTSKNIEKEKSPKLKFKKIFSSKKVKDDNKNKDKPNDFHTNFFKILKGDDNTQIINSFLKYENYGKNKTKNKKEVKNIEKKLEKILPEIMIKKRLAMKRIPLYIKKYKKGYEYDNNQIILDEINEKRYTKYDEPFKYSLNKCVSKEVLPKYNNLFFKYEKRKIRDYFYKKTLSNFHLTNSASKNNNIRGEIIKEIKLKKDKSTSFDLNESIKNSFIKCKINNN